MAGYEAEVRINTKVDTSQMQRLQIQIDKATNKAAALSEKYEELKNKKIPTSDFLEVQKQIDQTQTRLNALLAKKESFQGRRKGTAWLGMNAEIEEMEKALLFMKGELKDLVDTGKAFMLGKDTDEFRRTANDIALAESELRALLTKQGELGTKQNKVSDGLKKISEVSKKTFGSMHKDVKQSSGLFSTFAARLKGIALSLLIFNWITKAFKGMVNGVKEGFQNLVKYSDDYNKSISALKSANTQLKNSFATAFAPILQMIIPYLITLINYITAAANKAAQFIAVLTGKSTWIKAISVQEDYADSLNGTASAAKKAAGALASFDTLEVLNKKDSSTGGGTKPGDMFEEVPVDQNTSEAVKNLKDWLEKLKEAAQPAIEAFHELWEEGLAKLKEFTFDTLKDFYNSFLVPVGIWTLGEGLPRFFNVTNDLLNEIDWGRLRTSLDALYIALSKLTIVVLDGLLDFYEYFLKPLAVWAMSSAILQLVDLLADFIDKVDWEKLNKSLESFWKAIEPYAEQFGQGLIDFFAKLKNVGIAVLNKIPVVIDLLTKALNNGDPEAARSWGNALGNLAAAILLYKTGTKVATTLSTLVTNLGSLITMGTITVMIAVGIQFAQDYLDWQASIDEYGWDEGRKIYAEKVKEASGENTLNKSKEAGGEWMQGFWDGIVAWCDSVDNAIFGEEIGKFFEGGITSMDLSGLWEEIKTSFTDGWNSIDTWWSENAPLAFMGEWFEEDVKPLFTEETWSTLGQGILDGISIKWNELVEWWNTSALGLWWEENVAPWFTTETWATLGQGILDGISTKWNELVTWWDENIVTWWDEYVAPWFTAERWTKLGEGMKKGIYNGFCGIVSKVTDVINGVIKACENMVNYLIDKINEFITVAIAALSILPETKIEFTGIQHVKFEPIKPPTIPALANGAVLRGGNPFLAILGDQPRGQTNIEAPAGLIRQMVAEGMNQGGQQYTGGNATINLNYDGETFARFFLKDFLSEMNRQGYDIDVLGGLT